jgi:hypothetical protein
VITFVKLFAIGYGLRADKILVQVRAREPPGRVTIIPKSSLHNFPAVASHHALHSPGCRPHAGRCVTIESVPFCSLNCSGELYNWSDSRSAAVGTNKLQEALRSHTTMSFHLILSPQHQAPDPRNLAPWDLARSRSVHALFGGVVISVKEPVQELVGARSNAHDARPMAAP